MADELGSVAVPVAGFGREGRVGRVAMIAVLLACEIAVISAVGLATGVGYHLAARNELGDVASSAGVSLLVALLFTVPFDVGGARSFDDIVRGQRGATRAVIRWNYAFLCLAVIGFLTKTTALLSRGWLVGFYGVGLVTVVVMDLLAARGVAAAIAAGHIARRRVVLVGMADEIARFTTAVGRTQTDFTVTDSIVMPHPPYDLASQPAPAEATTPAVAAAVAAAVETSRALDVDDVILLTDWSRGQDIGALVEAFSVLPVAVHLGASTVLGRFPDARVDRFGRATTLRLAAEPLTPTQAVAKRLFDLAIAGSALVLLAPVFAALALAIRIDGGGPALLRQRRRGLNLREFDILKFRTMTAIGEASPGDDAQVTAVGRLMRTLGIDRLPQLINVIAGDMSLVGPRPHSIAQDERFETRIAKYRRRLNVRPGITGWAQVNDLRGPIRTDADMRARLDYDLYYIDHWSVTFDLSILAASLLSLNGSVRHEQ